MCINGGSTDDGDTKEVWKHGEGTDSEVVLSAEPVANFAGGVAKSISKLYLCETPFLHEIANLGWDGKRDVDFGDEVL